MASSISRVLLLLSLSALLLAVHSAEDAPDTSPSHVLTLDAANFDETIAKHDFLVVEFYAPWCGHCKSLEPEYEVAAAALRKHDPPIVLAKVDADDQANKELASKYDVSGFPTLKILRNKGQQVQDYNGPREADGIVEYLTKQSGPASVEIKSADDNVIDEKKVFIVGIFPEYSGEEYKNFMTVAEKMRSEYDFGHTLEAKFLPKGEPSVKSPTVRLLKPFDEFSVDFQDFDVNALEKFISESSVPLVTIFNNDPSNQPYVMKFFNNENAKAMFFLNFSSENFEQFKSQYTEVVNTYTGKKISFLMGDLEASEGAFQYFSLKEDQVPLIVIQSNDGDKYLKTNLQPLDIAAWIKEYMDGKAKPYKKSEPIPEVNNEPVKVVVGDNIHDFVLGSGKNVLIEFYAPWCGHCQQLAPILEEVAISFEKDPDVIIAKLDATANDVPKEFDVQGFPTMYFSSASGKLVNYDGGRSKEDIIEFIQANRDVIQTAVESDTSAVETDSPKDEL